jgi:ion channel POLLUX/CASTOR
LTVVPYEIPLALRRVERRQERLLMIGWSPKAATVIAEYGDYVLEGSRIEVLLHQPSDDVRREVEAAAARLEGVELAVVERNPLDIEELASVTPFAYDTVLVLRRDPNGPQNAERVDAESVMVLLHLRRLRAQVPPGTYVGTKIITEVLDSENQDLIARAGVDDFIISERLVSMVFAQLSEEPRMKLVYDDLFREEGSEIYVKPARLYFDQLPAQARFCDLMRLAQSASGRSVHRLQAQGPRAGRDEELRRQPRSPKEQLITITANDALVVVSEDDR